MNQRRGRRLALVTVGLFVSLGMTASTLNPRSPDELRPNFPPASDLVFERVPGPDVLTLQAIAGDAATDAEALRRVVAYYQAERDRLRVLWRESNETRLAGLFSMYVVHVSHIYGETRYQTSFVDYLTLARSHCGTASLAQAAIAQALGLEWRLLALSSGWHGWLEIRVDGRWEIFDSTVNVWIDRPAFELVQGGAREYRAFYTPLLDRDRPDARLHLAEGYNMLELRTILPGWGLFYQPPGRIRVSIHTAEVAPPNE